MLDYLKYILLLPNNILLLRFIVAAFNRTILELK